MMPTETSVSASIGPLTGALLGSLANVAEDGSLCFVSDKLYRVCPGCGTVFTGSAWRVAMTGPENCPFCGGTGTRPIRGLREA